MAVISPLGGMNLNIFEIMLKPIIKSNSMHIISTHSHKGIYRHNAPDLLLPHILPMFVFSLGAALARIFPEQSNLRPIPSALVFCTTS